MILSPRVDSVTARGAFPAIIAAVRKGSQDDHNDVARAGRTLRNHELKKAVKVIEQDLEYLLEEWHEYKRKANG
jgi:hypothetical protein